MGVGKTTVLQSWVTQVWVRVLIFRPEATPHLVMPQSRSVWFFEDFEEPRPEPSVRSKKSLNLEPDHRFRFSGFGSGPSKEPEPNA